MEPTSAEPDSPEDNATMIKVASTLPGHLLEFSGRLLSSTPENQNLILSPISIHKSLSMVLMGVDNSTQTERELIDVLGFKDLAANEIIERHEEYSRIIANFEQINKKSMELHAKKPDPYLGPAKEPIFDLFNMIITKNKGKVLSDYRDKITKYYNSSVVELDDSEPNKTKALLHDLDKWGKKAEFQQPIMTQEDVAGEFAAILLSAIRVQGFWFSEFWEGEGEGIFHQFGQANQPISGKFLSDRDIQGSRYIEFAPADRAKHLRIQYELANSSSAALFKELSSLNFHAVEVPLVGGLTFTIIEPLNVSASGGELGKLTRQLLSNSSTPSKGKSNLDQALSLLDSELGTNKVSYLKFPKFNFENDIDLKPVLKSMGLRRAFDKNIAEISNLTKDKIYIDKIKHQAMVDVNKFGFKAAAVTTIRMAYLTSFVQREPIEVDVKNPFMFIIRHQGLPLFIGQLVELSQT